MGVAREGGGAQRRLDFVPPGGVLGEAASKLLNVVPGMLAGKALRRFKSLAETGEIPTTEHNPSPAGAHVTSEEAPSMRALCWNGSTTCAWRPSPTPRSSIRTTRSCG